jgi:hypothetical protein
MNDATTAQTTAASTLLVSGIMFGISALVTLAFGYALLADPARLADAWVWVRSLPIIVQVAMWLLFLPWMASLWVWSLPLAFGLRVAIVVVVLGVSEYLLFPWKR